MDLFSFKFGTAATNRLIRFHVVRSHRFKINGKNYRLMDCGVETIQRFLAIHDGRLFEHNRWIYPTIRSTRKIVALDRRVVMTYLIQNLDHPFPLALAIWLRGRMGGKIGSKTIDSFRDSPYPEVRKEVARASHRMSNWATLDWMAFHDEDPQIRLIAKSRKSKPFAERLRKFQGGMKKIKPATLGLNSGKTAFTANIPCPVTREFPPKSPAQLRRILQRIKRLAANPDST